MSAAHALHETAERLRSKGVRAVIAKPFDPDALMAVVERYAPLASERSPLSVEVTHQSTRVAAVECGENEQRARIVK
jgi:AmiR/NasT family two-component response regulator